MVVTRYKPNIYIQNSDTFEYVMFDVLVLCFTTKRRHYFQYRSMMATSSDKTKNYIWKRPYGGAALVAGSETKSSEYVMFDVLVLFFTAKRRHCFQYLRMVATCSGCFKNYNSRRPYGGAALVADSEN